MEKTMQDIRKMYRMHVIRSYFGEKKKKEKKVFFKLKIKVCFFLSVSDLINYNTVQSL